MGAAPGAACHCLSQGQLLGLPLSIFNLAPLGHWWEAGVLRKGALGLSLSQSRVFFSLVDYNYCLQST